MSNDAPVTDAPDDFVSLLLAHQRGIYSFLVTLLPFEADLDDLFQQVCLALWQKRADYDATRPFLPWAYAFARHAALKHLKSRTRDRAVIPIGMETLERIAMAREAADPVIEARRSALEQCVEKLAPEHGELLRRRFAGTEKLSAIAVGLGVSVASLTMRLQRIRRALLQCAEAAIAAREGS